MSEIDPAAPYAPPSGPVVPQAPAPVPEQGDATGGVIPYKNPAALVAYYLGVFSIIPCFPLGIAAFVLGIIGLRKRRQHPAIKGAVHAWIGIIAGGFFGLLYTVFTLLTIYGMIQSSAQH
jgi:hypothetical protein